MSRSRGTRSLNLFGESADAPELGARMKSLVALIEKATGKAVNRDWNEEAETEVSQFDDTEGVELEEVNEVTA